MSKYDPLRRQLESCAAHRVAMSFAEVERVLGFPLPRSARLYQAWWANTAGSHAHALSWLNAGMHTADLDLAGEKVTFVRNEPTARAGVEEPGRAFLHGKIVIDADRLAPFAARVLGEYTVEAAGDATAAVSRALEEAGVARRRQLLERFPLTGERSAIDSTDLIREGRDGR
ncbi:MAG TPA: hypothetical protein VFE03_14590 [Caulobacteraceae bacterium]|jgi:hypothetical protein|nr:hypothetical protein [Caulobacteraceae bacterium]